MARSILFTLGDVRACPIESDDGPMLQDMLERCDDYFESATGFSVGPAEALSMFMVVPEGKGCEDKVLIGIFDHEELVGVVDAIRDYPEVATWWIGLMLLVPGRRGRGLGKTVYQALERWIADQGGKHVRLAVAKPMADAVALYLVMGRAIPTEEAPRQ